MKIDPRMAETTTGLSLKTPPIHITAGEHRVTAAFIQRFEGPVNDLIAPIDHTLADTQIGVAVGITTLPHVKDFSIVGPYNVTGISDTASRRKIFTCRPTSAADEAACAGKIVRGIATQAFRGPVSDRDFNGLMKFYTDSRKEGDFEYAIGGAIEAILASPQFLFRLENTPGDAARRAVVPAERSRSSRRACRISSGAPAPDAELTKLASRRPPERAGCVREAGRAPARRSAIGSALDALRAPVAAPRRRRRRAARRGGVSVFRSHARRCVRQGIGAVLRQPRARGSQHPRSADRGLLVRQRAHRAALRHSERHRQRLPPRHAAARAPRHPDAGQRAGADLGGRSHLAGDARQVGDGSDDGLAAAGAAAGCAGVRGDQGRGRRQGADRARAHGRASREPDLHVVPSRDRSDRPGARELRRHRQVPHQGCRRAGRSEERAVRRHADRRPGRAARGAAEAPGRRCS